MSIVTRMKAVGTLAPIEPEMKKIYSVRAESCLSKAREAATAGHRDAVQHFLDEAAFWKGHADAIATGLRGNGI